MSAVSPWLICLGSVRLWMSRASSHLSCCISSSCKDARYYHNQQRCLCLLLFALCFCGCVSDLLYRTQWRIPWNDRQQAWQVCHQDAPSLISLWKCWYVLRLHIRRPSSPVIRALIAAARCKQHVILFVSPGVLFSNFVLLTSNLGIQMDLERAGGRVLEGRSWI